MAGVEFKGLDSLEKTFADIEKIVQGEAIDAGEDAAAEIFKTAIHAAAPQKTGDLRSSISIVESRTKNVLSNQQGSSRRRLYVGPSKKKGFYGFFLEKGWITSHGRRRRAATKTTHSQTGPTAGGRKIPGREWFKPAVEAVMGRAEAAYHAAFGSKINELANKGQ